MSSSTVRFAAEFDDTQLVQGLNSAKSAINSLTTNIEPITLFGPEVLQDLDKLEQSTNSMEQAFNGLDSASTGLSGTFQEIGDAASQTGDNFNTLGTSTQTIEQQLAEIGTTSVTAGQSLSALGGSADTTGTSMGALNSAFEETTGTSSTLMQSLEDSTKQFGGLGDEAQTTGDKVKEIFSKGGGIAVGISATISGIANLVRGFRDYDDAQNRVRKANIALTTQQGKANTAQTKYNAAVAAYGANSAQAQAASADLTKELAKLEVKQTNLEIATKRAGDSQLQVWLGLGSSVTGIAGSMIQSFEVLSGGKGLAGLQANALAAGTAMLGFGGALTIVGGGIALAIGLLIQDNKLMEAFAASGVQLTKVQTDSNKAFAEMNAITRVTHMNMAEVIADPIKAAASYKAMNGAVDANGNIVTTTADQWDSARSPLQILVDTLGKTITPAKDSSKAITGTGKAVDTTSGFVTQAHNPLMRYKSVWDEVQGKMVDVPNGLKVTGDAINTVTGAVYDSTTEVIKNNGMWIDMGNVLQTTTGNVQKLTPAVKDVNATLKDHGAEIKAAAAAQYGYDTTVKNSIQTSTGFKTTLVSLDQELNNSFGMWAKAGDAIIKVGDDYIDLGNATKFNSLSQKDQNATVQAAIKINEDYKKSLEDSAQKMADITKEGHEWDDTLAILNSVTGQHIVRTDADAESLKGLAGALKTSREAFKGQETAMGLVLDKHGLLTTAIELQIADNNDDTEALKKLIIEQVNWSDALTNTTTQIKNHNTGVEQAVEAMEKYINEAQVSAAQTEAMNKGYVKVGQSIAKDFAGGIKLTVPQLQELGKHLGTAEEQAQAFSDIIQSKMEPAMSKLSSAINATNIKDFNQAFDDIDFGTITGEMEEFAKSVSFGFQQIADKQDQMENLFAVVTLGLDKMTQSQASEWMGKIEQKFNAIAKIDPSKFTGEVKNLVASFDSMSKVDIDKHAQSIQYLISNLSTWDSGKAEIFLGKWKAEDLDPAATATNTLGTAIGGTGDKAGVAAPKLDSVAAALTSVNLAAADVANKMANLNFEFAPPKLDLIAQVFTDIGTAAQLTADGIAGLVYDFAAPNIKPATDAIIKVAKAFDTLVNGINKAKPTINIINANANKAILQTSKAFDTLVNGINKANPTIHVNNSQALSAINKVASALNSLKNKTVTITTRYVTVGRPAAHNITGRVGAHNITGAGGATETPIAALTTGGGNMSNTNTISSGGGSDRGDVNVTINMHDEFGIEKQRKFKAVLGRDRYVFGSVGAGG